MINATRSPELHIRDVAESDFYELQVRCVLQSIVDESREIRRPETGKLQPFGVFFPYVEVRSQSTDVDVIVVGSVIFQTEGSPFLLFLHSSSYFRVQQ